MSEPSCPLYFQLQVSYGNLHDALEASSFDKLPEAGKCRETWYETLPAAIFMGLSRFSYNVGTSEKLHNRFLFPKVLYMDRYMKKNAKKVLELRKDQKVLREKLAQVKAELKGYLEYPHGENTEKIADLLETVRKVLSNNIAREDPIDSNNATNFIGPCSSKKSHIETKSFVEDLGKQFPRFTPETFPHLSQCINTLEAIEDDVKMKERELRTREEELVAALDTLYNKKEMHDYEYDLQAVIIHSGEANRGHYWTYSRKQSGNTQEEWEKLNDKQIEIVPWEKVAKDAYGDDMASSPSAYCLVYVRSDAKWLFEQNFLTHQEALNELPEDLKKLVTEKQKIASENLDRFLEEKARKAQEEEQEASKRWMNRRGENRSARRTLSNTRRSDENANPNIIGIPNNSIRAPLSEQQCVLDDDAVKDLETSAERMNDTIRTMSPNKFQDVGDIINYWLMDLMASFGTGFLLRALDEVSGFKKENEVFSDYSKEHIYVTYEKFIEHFVPTVERSVGARDNIISFLKSTITAIDPWVWRYMLVKALSMGGTDSPFTMKARSELGMYTRMHPRAAKNVQKVAMWCGLLYENLNITMCMCSQSIDMFLQHENETNQHKCVEYSYYALKKARAARYAYNVFKSELMQAEQQILTEKESIDYTFIQIATLCPLLKMTKVFLPFVVNKGRKMTEIAYPTGDGKKIEANDVVNEIVYALYAVRRWKQNKTAVDELFFNCINDIYEKSSILWDTVAALGVPTNDASKKFYVNKIRDLFHTNHLLEEKCPNQEYWSGGIRAEHAKLVGFASRIGVSQNLIATIFGEANIIISQSLENL